MKDNIDSIEYQIRKSERGLGMMLKLEPHPHQKSCYQSAVMELAWKISSLKKQLYKLTGKCTPKRPRWPL